MTELVPLESLERSVPTAHPKATTFMDSPSPSGFFPQSFELVTSQDTSQDNRQLFFAKCSKTAGEDEIKLLFSEYGTVLDVIIFQSSQGSGTSKGCGLVTMSTHEEAAAALAGLHGKFAWSNRDPPMVVTWMDAALQDPSRSNAIAAGNRPDAPPTGCDPDAVKLFVGNIPLTYTEEQLLPLFQQIGPVVELVLVRNKLNSLSKGCAFVWFQSKEHAEQAITALNLKHMLPDITGQQHRPLVVRKARTGHMASALLGKTTSGDSSPLNPSVQAVQQRLLGSSPLQPVRIAAPRSHPILGRTVPVASSTLLDPSGLLASAPTLNPRFGMSSAPVLTSQNAPTLQYTIHGTPAASVHQVATPGAYTTLHPSMELLHQGGQMALHTLPGGGTYLSSGAMPGAPHYQVISSGQPQPQYLVMDVPSGLQHMGLPAENLEPSYMPMPTHAAPAAPTTHGTVMSLDSAQLAIVNDRLFSVQSTTGCSIMVSPGGPGTFSLLLSGERSQVERAQLTIASMIQENSAQTGTR